MSAPLTMPARLRETLEDSLLVRHIAVRLETCGPDEEAREVRSKMQERGYDVMGLIDEGRIIRYVRIEDLTDGKCCDHSRPIETTQILASTTPLIDLLPLMKCESPFFVLEGAKLNSIVTRADLQKQPVRMLLFGLVSLLDMHLTAMVRQSYTDDSYLKNLSPKRREDAQKLYQERVRRNEEIDLADCLQICDKRTLILRMFPVKDLGFQSKGKATDFFDRAETLRNNLAHSQDLLLGGTWSEVIDLAGFLEELLHRIDLGSTSESPRG